MAWWRRLFGVAALVAMLWLVLFSDGKGLIMNWLEQSRYPLFWVLLVTSTLYALALAVPYLPAVELGWMVMAAFGKAAILSIWLATPVGLLIAFALGYWMREWPWVDRLSSRFRGSLQEAETRGNGLGAKALRFADRNLVNHPYWVLAVLVNTPGNWLIGGGGGIGILAGASGLYHPLRYFLVLVPATGVVAMLMLLGLYQKEA